MFNEKQTRQIQSKGIGIETIEMQLTNFRNGFPFAKLDRPAIVGDGIEKLDDNTLGSYINLFDKETKNLKVIKFVPASGAASRMFKNLYEFLEDSKISGRSDMDSFSDKGFNSVYNFLYSNWKFAFYKDLNAVLEKDGFHLKQLFRDQDYSVIIDYLLNDKGLGYGNLPKGLLKFHDYNDGARVPLEEHLVEAINYGRSGNVANVHFTVSPEHLTKFQEQVEKVKEMYEDRFGIKFHISFSMQKPSTDTIAVDMDNEPFVDKDGNLLFRPGGHGALIENLNDLDGDIVFIKNIDNVVPDRLKDETTKYKKAIGGFLLSVQNELFNHLVKLDQENPGKDALAAAKKFAEEKIKISIPEDYYLLSESARKDYLISQLNKPIRVCGMVKNEGEPGGGPFWVQNSKGEVSLQIVESSQVDQNDPEQKEISNAATHFNPVDLVCGIKNYKGESFDLHAFVDPETGFISVKSKDGKNLKAQELPGLWNGAMANWITFFVEVPIITFNPVKTVNDLLREQHQPE
ncbi:MAG: DUF4301 family protein [Bacteroidales bacterium]